MDYLHSFSEVFLSLFKKLAVAINPLIILPIFIALFQGTSSTLQKKAAFKSCAFAFIFLSVVSVFGTKMLSILDISLQSLLMGGGFLLARAGMSMISPPATQGGAKKNPEDAIFFPLGFPMIVGPGSITLIIKEMMPYGQNMPAMAGAIGASFVIIASIYVTCLFAEKIAQFLGPVTISILEKIVGLVLLLFGVELLSAGVMKMIENVVPLFKVAIS